MAKPRKMGFLPSCALKESTPMTQYHSQELAGTTERAVCVKDSTGKSPCVLKS